MSYIVCDTDVLIHSDHTNFKEFRSAVKQWLINNHLHHSYVNIHTGHTITINKTGIDKIMTNIGSTKVHSFTILERAITEAILTDVQKDKKGRIDLISVHLFVAKVQIESSIYEMWLYIRERREGFFLYSLNLNNEKTL